MAVLLVPISLAFFFGLLALADALERRSSVFLVRSSLRSPLSCEETEAVVAANLAPFLEAAGLGREELDDDDADPDDPVVRAAAVAEAARRDEMSSGEVVPPAARAVPRPSTA